jgi:hypothetical protein
LNIYMDKYQCNRIIQVKPLVANQIKENEQLLYNILDKFTKMYQNSDCYDHS